jgi:hypothetical protein
MGEKSLDRSTEKAYLPPASPSRNHGHTKAAWVTVTFVMVGGAVASLAVLFEIPWLFWAGIGVIVVGVVLGWVMKMLGMGQPEPPRTTTRTDPHHDDRGAR